MQNVETPAAPFIAGLLTGRGGFGEDDGRVWLFFITLDQEVAAEAAALWGGRITARAYNDTTQWKWTVTGPNVPRVLDDLLPYLRGSKKHKAEELLKRFESAA